jgi:hypothetical protein
VEELSSSVGRSAGRSVHARTGSGSGLWGDIPTYQSPPRATPAYQSPQRAPTLAPSNPISPTPLYQSPQRAQPHPTSPTPLYPADDMVNRMHSDSVAEDERLTEDQILALYSGRSPALQTPLEREPFSFDQPAAKSPATTPSTSKQTTPRRQAAQSPTLAPVLPPTTSQSSSGGGLTSLFRKGSKFVRRGDQGENSRSKNPATSPDAKLSNRSLQPIPAATELSAGASTQPVSSGQAAENGRKNRTHTRQAASLEPTAWREQFLKSGMLNMPRPAPKSASQGNLA